MYIFPEFFTFILIFKDAVTDETPDGDVLLHATPLTSVFTKVQTSTDEEKKNSQDSPAEKSFLLELVYDKLALNCFLGGNNFFSFPYLYPELGVPFHKKAFFFSS